MTLLQAYKDISEDSFKMFKREADILRIVGKHENIIQMIGVCVDHPDQRPRIVLEEGGQSLRELIGGGRYQGQLKKIVEIAMGIVAGMKYLHSKGILHRDLNPNNILVQKVTKQVKLIDFGVSKETELGVHTHTANVGTRCFIAPELCSAEMDGKGRTFAKYSEKSEVYSFAMILQELCQDDPDKQVSAWTRHSKKGKKRGKNTGDHEENSVTAPPLRRLTSTGWPEMNKLIEECWALPPSVRPSFDEIEPKLQKLKELLETRTVKNKKSK